MAGPAAILLGAGALLNAYGAYQQGVAARAAGEYNAKVAEQNAQIARETAAEEERRKRIETRRQLGQMRSARGASGIQLDGSALDVLQDSAATAELDALTIRHQGEVQAFGYESQARMARMEGEAGYQAGMIGAAGSLLNAGGQAYGQGRLRRT